MKTKEMWREKWKKDTCEEERCDRKWKLKLEIGKENYNSKREDLSNDENDFCYENMSKDSNVPGLLFLISISKIIIMESCYLKHNSKKQKLLTLKRRKRRNQMLLTEISEIKIKDKEKEFKDLWIADSQCN